MCVRGSELILLLELSVNTNGSIEAANCWGDILEYVIYVYVHV